MNKFIGWGNLTRDPELRQTTNSQVCSFGLALNGRQFKKAGQEEPERDVTFVDCQVWDKGAEVISKWFTKGMPIAIEGELRQDNWVDKTTGQNRSKLYVRVNQFEFLPKNAGTSGEASAERGEAEKPAARKPRNKKAPPAQAQDVNFDETNGDTAGGEEIPF